MGIGSGIMRSENGLEKDTGFGCTAQESRTGRKKSGCKATPGYSSHMSVRGDAAYRKTF